MICKSTDGKQRVLSLSYGKDSMACLGAIEQLGWSLDRIITADVWATDTIPADLPPMVEFKSKADAIILERYGFFVEHYWAMKNGEKNSYDKQFYEARKSARNGNEVHAIYGFPFTKGSWCNDRLKTVALEEAKKMTYEKMFYHVRSKGKREGQIVGFPFAGHNECNKALKMAAISEAQKSCKANTVSYVGIAADEPKRLERLDGVTTVSPLAAVGWTEADCMKWCIENGLRSPLYDTVNRGGCWFCHNQGVGQLRLLRKNYPELWALLMKWDDDSPVTFHADGHTVHDFDRRFQCEDEGLIYADERFKWADIEQPQMRWF